MKFVTPVYPREARLEHIEGVVKLALVIAEKGPVVDLQPVSGDPLLVDAAMKAVRQWRIYAGIAVVGGRPVECEIALTFTFRIQHPPRPAYLHLRNGDVVRADEVHEFTDGFEYAVGHDVHRTPADLVTNVDACARVTVAPRKERDCIPAGRPSFDIRAIPLRPVTKPSPFDTPLHSIATESKSERIRERQNHLCRTILQVVNPIYPKEARLAHIQGVVTLTMIIGVNGAVTDLEDISGDPLLSIP